MSRRGRRRHAHGCGAEPLHALRHRVLAPAPLHLRGPLWTRLAGRRSSFGPGWTMLTRLESSRGRHGGSRSAADADRLRSHRAARPLVGAAAPHRRRSRHVRGLHHLGGPPGRALPIWKLSVPLLLARALRIGPRLVRAAPRMVAGMAGLLAGPGHPLGARRLPSDLLLLPGRLLQGLLGRPALVRGERAPSALPRRGFAAAGPAERPPILPLPRPGVPAHPYPRRLECDVVPGALGTHLRHRRRYAGPPRQHDPARRVRARMPLVASPRGRRSRPDGGGAGAEGGLRLCQLPQPPAHGVGLDEPVRRGPGRSVRPAVLDGCDPRLENHLTAQVQTHEHDVLVIGAGGAGLRAAIEASTAKVSVGLVCKSLLGKAHTVMAEGGIAAALSNVDERDSWKVHFADTMRGGQYVNNWRMAELHAREAPARVRELEAWGALFDRTRDGRILQR